MKFYFPVFRWSYRCRMDAKDIINEIKADGERGFRLLMAKYGEPVYWHIRRLVVVHADAQDATQETFIRAFRAIGKLNDGGKLTAWIYRIATNEALRVTERRRAEMGNGNGGNALDMMADSYVDYDNIEAVRLQRAILALPRKQQVTFNLRYYDEMDYAAIAEVTETTPSGAKANYHAAKEKIIKYMNEND